MTSRSAAVLLACSVIATYPAGAGQPSAADDLVPLNFGYFSYPPVALSARVEGAVPVKLVIGADGLVQSADALGGPAMLSESSAANARGWRFRKGRERILVVTYVFEIDGFCDATPPQTLMRLRPPYDDVRVTSCHRWTP